MKFNMQEFEILSRDEFKKKIKVASKNLKRKVCVSILFLKKDVK
jgi:hypothetical protein